MRRPKATFSKAVVAIALSAAAGVHAQQPTSGVAPGTTATAPVKPRGSFTFSARNRAKTTKPTQQPQPDPMASARGAKQLLRNGEDYISYGQYDRALDFLREAESRQFELSAAERKTLNSDILRAQRGLRGLDDAEAVATNRKALARRSTGSPSASERPGAIVLAVPRSDGPLTDDPRSIQLTSATQEEPAAKTAIAEGPAPAARPATADLGPESLPPLPPEESVAPARSPEPLSMPAEVTAPPPPLPESPEPGTLPRDVPGTLAAEPPAPAPLSAPPPNTAPVELANDPLPAVNAAPAEVPQPSAAPLSDLPPSIAPVEAPQAAAEPPPPILLEEEEAPAAELDVAAPITTAPPPLVHEEEVPAPATTTASKPETVKAPEDPTALPPLVLEEAPATAPPVEPPSGPVEGLKIPENVDLPVVETATAPAETPMPEPVVRTVQAEPAAEAPVPVVEEPIAPPPAPEASSVALPPLPDSVAETPAVPPATSEDTPAAPTLRDRATSALSEHKRPVLSDDAKRRIEQIARRQQDDSARNPAPAIDAPTANNSYATADDMERNRLELPRAPSPTEIRPIRAIPIPEEFVPLVPRQWTPSRKAWTAAATGHGPLYFQDAVLERYGQSIEHAIGSKGRFLSYPLDDPRESNQRNQILQPFFSIGLFASQVALLPYNLVVDPPWEGEYDLGYYRPGDRVPPDTTYLPIGGVGPPLRGRHY